LSHSIFFSALAQGLQSLPANSHLVTQLLWSSALKTALAHLYTYTHARPPSRTLIDPLTAFIETFPDGFAKAVQAAGNAAEATRTMDAKVGRSAYIEVERLKEKGVPDPGAWGVKTLLEGLLG
jgi:dihydroxyacetone kinase